MLFLFCSLTKDALNSVDCTSHKGLVFDRFMEMKNGHLGFVNLVLEFLAVLRVKIQCIPTVSALFLEKQTVQFSK